MKKLVLIAALSLGVCVTPATAQTIKLKVLGQPLATGLIQKNKEQPFFENLAKMSGLLWVEIWSCSLKIVLVRKFTRRTESVRVISFWT